MAVGVGDNDPTGGSGDIFADENQAKMEQFQLTDSAAGKLAIAFSYGNYPWGPGVEFRYNSTHTFVLGAAMDAYLKSREGPQADIGDLLRDEVYAPIGIHHLPLIRALEANGARGLPEFFVGLYPTVDDLAKIVTLLQGEGAYAGLQILDPDLTRTMLYRGVDRGLARVVVGRPGRPDSISPFILVAALRRPGRMPPRHPGHERLRRQHRGAVAQSSERLSVRGCARLRSGGSRRSGKPTRRLVRPLILRTRSPGVSAKCRAYVGFGVGKCSNGIAPEVPALVEQAAVVMSNLCLTGYGDARLGPRDLATARCLMSLLGGPQDVMVRIIEVCRIVRTISTLRTGIASSLSANFPTIRVVRNGRAAADRSTAAISRSARGGNRHALSGNCPSP